MSWQIQDLVLHRSKAKGSRLALMIAIANYTDDRTGLAYPGEDKLSKLLGINERATRYLISSVVKSGELTITERGRGGKTNRYKINVDLLRAQPDKTPDLVSKTVSPTPNSIRQEIASRNDFIRQSVAPLTGNSLHSMRQSVAPNPLNDPLKRSLKTSTRDNGAEHPERFGNAESVSEILRSLKSKLVTDVGREGGVEEKKPDYVPTLDLDDLQGSIKRMVGDVEWKKNAGMWIARVKRSRRAMIEAISDFADLAKKNRIRNRAAWLTDRYERNAKQLKQNAAR